MRIPLSRIVSLPSAAVFVVVECKQMFERARAAPLRCNAIRAANGLLVVTGRTSSWLPYTMSTRDKIDCKYVGQQFSGVQNVV